MRLDFSEGARPEARTVAIKLLAETPALSCCTPAGMASGPWPSTRAERSEPIAARGGQDDAWVVSGAALAGCGDWNRQNPQWLVRSPCTSPSTMPRSSALGLLHHRQPRRGQNLAPGPPSTVARLCNTKGMRKPLSEQPAARPAVAKDGIRAVEPQADDLQLIQAMQQRLPRDAAPSDPAPSDPANLNGHLSSFAVLDRRHNTESEQLRL
jgi:hypothetical protein